ncbi:hypothetical protein KIN20_015278 [Parelaphostrongylus tenuis]|uniref:Uncharacterized protein n=1 Tax=Parelaphostrongylus tenuis TaxID=148309 RepID=A0AAD5MEM8_PARTN|nr:hypothetical protein KIN20_015278 [Parelaphostrongylus tenuis]
MLSVKDPHPLRVLQKGCVDRVFTPQNTLILPDETLYQDWVKSTESQSTFPETTSGGCPFMAHSIPEAIHDEL